MDKKTKTLERLITQKPEEYKEESTETRPEGYIEYAQDRLRTYKEENGELPRYSKEVTP